MGRGDGSDTLRAPAPSAEEQRKADALAAALGPVNVLLVVLEGTSLCEWSVWRRLERTRRS